MPRLLVCNTHKTVDILPDYDTASDMEGKHDHALRESIDRHLDKYGSDPGAHKSLIMRIVPEEFELLDPERIKQAVMDDSLETYLKEEREGRKQQALSCYELHNRPTYGVGYGVGCPDYRSDSRAIGVTKGISKKDRMYLCDFCPYESYVEHAKTKQVRFKGEK
jgi:hypothetical protein